MWGDEAAYRWEADVTARVAMCWVDGLGWLAGGAVLGRVGEQGEWLCWLGWTCKSLFGTCRCATVATAFDAGSDSRCACPPPSQTPHTLTSSSLSPALLPVWQSAPAGMSSHPSSRLWRPLWQQHCRYGTFIEVLLLFRQSPCFQHLLSCSTECCSHRPHVPALCAAATCCHLFHRLSVLCTATHCRLAAVRLCRNWWIPWL